MKNVGPQRVTFAAGLLVLAYVFAFAILKWVPHYDCIVFVLVVLAAFRALEMLDPRPRTIALHALTQVLVFAYVVHLWTLGYEGRNAVLGGTMPMSDSFDFFEDALRLWHGERFGEPASKRPFFPSLLAVLLGLTGGSLRAALVPFAIAAAFTTALATNAVWKTHGWRSAFFVWLLLFFFDRRWAGFVQTEHVGFPLGLIGFTMIWRANALIDARPPDEIEDSERSRATKLVLSGIACLAIGLMARAGAFFILPAIALWGARALASKRNERLRFLAFAAGAMAVGWGGHKVLLALTGQGVTFSDYAGIFYGMMHGQDYTFLHERHPELPALAVHERVPAAWKIILAEAKAEPSKVIIGFFKSGIGLFTHPNGMFGYVWRNPDDSALENAALMREVMKNEGLLGPLFHWRRTLGTYSLLNSLPMGVMAVVFVLGTAWSTFVVLVRKRKERSLSLLRWAIAGVITSAPFTPPWITSGQQVQTVTLAFVAALPAVVLFGRPDDAELPEPERTWPRIVFFPIAFVAIVLALVGALRASPAARPQCGEGTARVVRIFPGTMVDVEENRSLSFRKKGIRDLEYAMTFLTRHNRDARSIAPHVKVGTRFVAGFDACDAKAKIVIDEHAAIAPDDDRWMKIESTVLDPGWVLLVTNASYVEPVLP